MTPAATRFVGRRLVRGRSSGRRCWATSSSAIRCAARSRGIRCPPTTRSATSQLVSNADVYLIAPASANTIAKLAAGIADSMVTTSFLACTAPRAVAPAMNDRMFANAATQANLATLRERGIRVIDPEEGALASRGEHGVGQPALASAPAGRSRGARGPGRGLVGRAPGPGDGRRDPGADRLRALHRQSLERSHGARAGRPSGTARRGSDPGRRQRVTPRGPRRSPHRRRDHE